MAALTRNVTIPGERIRMLAAWIIKLHPLYETIDSLKIPPDQSKPVSIVCISDTHNTQPEIPPGDVLIHAGDLTENGSFDELQTQLKWLSSQPHKYKIVISGNHDVLLDEEFLEKYPERRYEQAKTASDLDWGSIEYLRDTSTILEFPYQNDSEVIFRRLKVFGSPWTPRYIASAFQYPREDDIWYNRILNDADIVVTHGPPRLYLDTAGLKKAGCIYLAKEISRVRPQLAVFGHIHAGHGRTDVALDRSRQLHDNILNHWGGYWCLFQLACAVLYVRFRAQFGGIKALRTSEQITTLINASIVGGLPNELKNKATVVIV